MAKESEKIHQVKSTLFGSMNLVDRASVKKGATMSSVLFHDYSSYFHTRMAVMSYIVLLRRIQTKFLPLVSHQRYPSPTFHPLSTTSSNEVAHFKTHKQLPTTD